MQPCTQRRSRSTSVTLTTTPVLSSSWRSGSISKSSQNSRKPTPSTGFRSKTESKMPNITFRSFAREKGCGPVRAPRRNTGKLSSALACPMGSDSEPEDLCELSWRACIEQVAGVCRGLDCNRGPVYPDQEQYLFCEGPTGSVRRARRVPGLDCPRDQTRQVHALNSVSSGPVVGGEF